MKPLVCPEWVNENLSDPDLVLLDASQKDNRSRRAAEFGHLQIPRARIFDLKGKFSLKNSDLPNMLPGAKAFEHATRKLGINKSSRIVVYDDLGTYFSPRAWWMFRAMGHRKIAVLNGGLPHWVAKGFDTELKQSGDRVTGNFCSSFQKSAVRDLDFINENIGKQGSVLIDARPSGRFMGTAPEPRKGLRSGNIPNSINLPFDDVMDNGLFRSKEELKNLFNNLGIDERPLVFSCGSGVTACIVLLACELVMGNDKSVYDGSWTEWRQRIT